MHACARATIDDHYRICTYIHVKMAQEEQGTFPVDSLVHQCYHYIAMNLEKFPVSYLSLLPLKIREELLWRLPIADICLLEDTEYVEGFQDLAAYWKLPCGEEFQGIPAGDPDIGRYVEEWDSVEYEKVILYSKVAIAVIGCRDPFEEFSFWLPFEDELEPYRQGIMIPLDDRGLVISPLYAVRKPTSYGECELSFPPRYHEMNNISTKRDIINAIIRCFKGKLPKLVGQICLHEEVDPEYYDLLNEVTYVGIYDVGLGYPTIRLVKQVVQRSTCLEVIVLDNWMDDDDEQTSLNRFFVFLSTQVSFLSRFRLFMITNLYQYSILQESLNKLITAYFSTPTTHLQKIRITDVKIKSYDGDVCPAIDQRYVQFKTIELEDCHFVSKQKSTRRAITQWLGQDISTLHVEKKDKGTNFCIFKVKEQAPGLLGRKRKHCEQ